MPLQFFHASKTPLKEGTILQGGWQGEYSSQLPASFMKWIELVERTKPERIRIFRRGAIFMVDSIEAGYTQWSPEEYVYTVIPIGQVYGPFDVGYFDAGWMAFDYGDFDEAMDMLERYWNGEEFGEGAWEYFAPKAKVAGYVGRAQELMERELNEIRRRAGL